MNFDTNPETRASLIARIRDSGDNEAWEEFVQIYQPLVQRFIQKHGLQYADAAEITQEVLGRVAHSIHSWDERHEKATFRGWLYRITRNLTIDFLRKRKIESVHRTGGDVGLSQVADRNLTPEKAEVAEFHAEYERQVFLWAAERLKPSFKPANWQAFWLSTVEGKPIEEVASQLQVECSTVYVARSRIMARLSKLVQSRMDDTQI